MFTLTRRQLLTNITGTGAVSEAFEPSHVGSIAVYIFSRTGVTSGAVQIEEAVSKDATVWVAVGAPVTVPAAGVMVVSRPFAQLVAVGAMRARVSTTIVGGVIDVWAVAG